MKINSSKKVFAESNKRTLRLVNGFYKSFVLLYTRLALVYKGELLSARVMQKTCYLFFISSLMLNLSCINNKSVKVSEPKTVKKVTVESINIILENSGSMAGFLNGMEFRRDICNLISEIDKLKSPSNNLNLKNISFLTFSDNMKLQKFSGNSFDFCDKINKSGLAIGVTSPTDDFVKFLVDSAKNSQINVFVSDFIVDKKSPKIFATLQSRFNIIFNKAREKSLGLLIYRFTSDFRGTFYPALGGAINVTDVERPYFIWLLGTVDQLNSIREYLRNSGIFKPADEISFGLPLQPQNVKILELSNRSGYWRINDENLVKAKLRNGKLKFTIALDLDLLPQYLMNPLYLKKNVKVNSTSLKIDSFAIYDRQQFKNKIHDKEKKYLDEFSLFIEINISEIISDNNQVRIEFKKFIPDWISSYTTLDDRIVSDTNSYKTFALSNIIDGIANAYGDLNSGTDYFQLKFKISK